MSIKRNDIFFCVGKFLRHKNSDEVLSWVNEKMCLKKDDTMFIIFFRRFSSVKKTLSGQILFGGKSGYQISGFQNDQKLSG